MENQIPVTQTVETSQVVQETPKVDVVQPRSNFLVILLSALLFLSISIAGFFAYQTQNLVKELNMLQVVITPTSEATVESTLMPVGASDLTAGWTVYTDLDNGFSIKHPVTWRTTSDSFFGVGPKEIGEDIIWTVNFYDINTNSLSEIADNQGKQFADRNQVLNKTSVGNLNATQIITTTPTIPDWYSETIVFEDSDTIFTIQNGAISDLNLQKMNGVTAGTTFKDFYSTFKLAN